MFFLSPSLSTIKSSPSGEKEISCTFFNVLEVGDGVGDDDDVEVEEEE